MDNNDELKTIIDSNKEFIINYLLSDELGNSLQLKINELQEKNTILKKENDTLIDKIQNIETKYCELKQVLNLNDKVIGEHSMYKGEYQEKKMELILKEFFSNDFDVIGDKHMKCMDIRVKNKKNGYILGVECKNKKSIIKKDIDKFKSDKTSNKFLGSIFITTISGIKNIVSKENSFKIINDELYIFSNDDIYIIMVIQNFINNLEYNLNDKKITVQTCTEHLSNLYTNWNNLKKCCIKMDIDFINYLNEIGLVLENGHLYITPKNKCKNNKIPYDNLKDNKLNDINTQDENLMNNQTDHNIKDNIIIVDI